MNSEPDPSPVPKTALVTGGTAGMGASIANALRRDGYDVAVCARRVDRLAALEAQGYRAVECDVGEAGQVQRLAQWIDARFVHGLAVLVNCAGVALTRAPIEDVGLADVERVLRVNLFGTIAVTQALLPAVIRARGVIVNFSSTLAQHPRLGTAVYSASKGGIEAFTKAIALEAAPHKVRVNCIAPGLVRSDIYTTAGMSEDAYRDMLEARAREMPLGRVGVPEDAAELVAFLVSERASWMTGVCVPLDGGGSLR